VRFTGRIRPGAGSGSDTGSIPLYQVIQSLTDLTQIKRLFPHTWKALNARRYVLSGAVRSEYLDQTDVARADVEYMLCEVNNLIARGNQNTEADQFSFLQCAHLLSYDLQTFFIKHDLGQALLRSVLPVSLEASDLRSPFPAFRVNLPKDLLVHPILGSCFRLEISQFEAKDYVGLPPAIHDEIHMNFNVDVQFVRVSHDGVVVSGFFGIGKSTLTEWRRTDYPTLKQVVSQTMTYDPTVDATDITFLTTMFAFGLKLMLFMADQPAEITKPPPPWRNPKKPTGKPGFGMYAARYIQPPLRTIFAPEKSKHQSIPTGEKRAPHWRRAHWRRQGFGLKHGQRKLVWIAPVHIGPNA
jgi:hypothetical protein